MFYAWQLLDEAVIIALPFLRLPRASLVPQVRAQV